LQTGPQARLHPLAFGNADLADPLVLQCTEHDAQGRDREGEQPPDALFPPLGFHLHLIITLLSFKDTALSPGGGQSSG
jgi:hypothetical protein